MHACIYNMTKVISLSDEAYKRLYDLKVGKESFSDVVLKVTEKDVKRPLSSFAGIWKGNKEMEEIFKQIEKERHEARTKDYEL
jgi:predicted CopG family antitoxin